MPMPLVNLPGDEPRGADFRWTASRKAEVVRRVTTGEIGLTDALRRYGLTLEEYDAWARDLDKGGHAALKARARRPGGWTQQRRLL